MTLEELKAFEKAHPEYAPLFRPIMAGFDNVAREEFEKAFKAIYARFDETKKEHLEKHPIPEEDAKMLVGAINEFINQVDKDFRKSVHKFFEENKP